LHAWPPAQNRSPKVVRDTGTLPRTAFHFVMGQEVRSGFSRISSNDASGGIGVVLKTSYDADTYGCSIVRFCHQDSPSHYACIQGTMIELTFGCFIAGCLEQHNGNRMIHSNFRDTLDAEVKSRL